MGLPVKRNATYEDLVAVPEPLIAEILDGDLYTQPRPASLHALAASRLGATIDQRFHRSGPGGWVILDEPELHLAGSVLVPDIAGWRRERMPEMPDAAAFELPPDWVCEVVSPSTEAVDRRRKMPIYHRAGTGHIWLVNPTLKLLEVYARGPNARWELHSTWENDESASAPPFEGSEIALAPLWQR
jgi:Uma2 family endonuclease